MIRRELERVLKEERRQSSNVSTAMNGLTAMNGDIDKHWYPSLKYKNNFLCGPICSNEISEKYKEKYVGP